MEEIITNMANQPVVELPYPVNYDVPSISVMTKGAELDARYKLYNKSGILRLYGKDVFVVIWHPNAISVSKSGRGQNTLSFDFSGCCMARYSVSGKGEYTAHIHCDARLQGDCRFAFIDYLRDNRINNCLIFRPLCNHDIFADFHGRNGIETWGLISENNHCYTVCVENVSSASGNCQYRIVCIIQHTEAEAQVWNGRLFTYLADIQNGFEELRQRWDTTFSNERCRRLYIADEYRQYLLQKWR